MTSKGLRAEPVPISAIGASLQKLKELVGLSAYAALRRGAFLHVWRRSSPWNYWVWNRRKMMVWHSNDWGDRPDLGMFEVLNSSWESSTLVLKPEYRVGGNRGH